MLTQSQCAVPARSLQVCTSGYRKQNITNNVELIRGFQEISCDKYYCLLIINN